MAGAETGSTGEREFRGCLYGFDRELSEFRESLFYFIITEPGSTKTIRLGTTRLGSTETIGLGSTEPRKAETNGLWILGPKTITIGTTRLRSTESNGFGSTRNQLTWDHWVKEQRDHLILDHQAREHRDHQTWSAEREILGFTGDSEP